MIVASSLELALLILCVEFALLALGILFFTRKGEQQQQDVAVKSVTSLVDTVSRTDDARREALRTTLQEIYRVEADEAEGMVQDFVEREHAFYNALIGVHLGRSGRALSDIPNEVTRLIAPWLRLTPRGQVDDAAMSALEDRNSALSHELDETRKVLETLMSEYNAAFSKRQQAGGGELPMMPLDVPSDQLLSMDDSTLSSVEPALEPAGETILAAAQPKLMATPEAMPEEVEAPMPGPAAETAPLLSPDTIINLDEDDEPQAPAMSQEDLDALLENLGEDIFGTGDKDGDAEPVPPGKPA